MERPSQTKQAVLAQAKQGVLLSFKTGAWVGSVSKLRGEIAAITSKHFFGYQLPAPPEVAEAVRQTFE